MRYQNKTGSWSANVMQKYTNSSNQEGKGQGHMKLTDKGTSNIPNDLNKNTTF